MSVADPDDPNDALMASLSEMYNRTDPVPPVVTEAARLALGWRRLDADLAELLDDNAVHAFAGVRGSAAPVRAVSFGAAGVTIDVEIHVEGEARQLLGQISPGAPASVEVQAQDSEPGATATADGLGRFRLPVPAGRPIRLRIVLEPPGSAPPLETSWITV